MKLRKTQFNAGDPTIQIYYTHEEPNLMQVFPQFKYIIHTNIPNRGQYLSDGIRN